MMECRNCSLFYFLVCCICVNVKSQNPGIVTQQLAHEQTSDVNGSIEGKQTVVDSRDKPEGKSATSRNMHMMLSERNISQSVVSLNILCDQWKLLDTERQNKNVMLCLCGNSYSEFRTCLRRFSIWRARQIVRQIIGTAGRIMLCNCSVGITGQLVTTSGKKYWYLEVYSTRGHASLSVGKITKHARCIICHIFKLVAGLSESFGVSMFNQPLLHHGRCIWLPGRQQQGTMVVCAGCAYSYCCRSRVNDLVTTSGNRWGNLCKVRRFRCSRTTVHVLNLVKQKIIVFGCQNKHANSSLRDGKWATKEYTINRWLLLDSLSSRYTKQPFLLTVFCELERPFSIDCSLILTQHLSFHSQIELNSRCHCRVEVNHLKWKSETCHNGSITLIIIAERTRLCKRFEVLSKAHNQSLRNATSKIFKFFQSLADTASDPYRKYVNKHAVLKDQRETPHASDRKLESAQAYVSEKRHNVPSAPGEGTATSTASLSKDLRAGRQVTGELFDLINKGLHNLNAESLAQSRLSVDKPASLESDYSLHSSSGFSNNPITIKEKYTVNSEKVFRSFHAHVQYFKISSPKRLAGITSSSANSLPQTQIIHDTNLAGDNYVSPNSQRQRQFYGDTNLVSINSASLNSQPQRQVIRETNLANDNNVSLSSQPQRQFTGDTQLAVIKSASLNSQLHRQVIRDTNLASGNYVSLNSQLHGQVIRDTNLARDNYVSLNSQLHGQVIRDTNLARDNYVSLNSQLHGQVIRDTNTDKYPRRRRNIASIVHDVIPVNMAILLPMSQDRLFCRERVFPAIEIAMKRVEDLMLLPSVQLQARYADSHCSISDAMNAAIEFYAKRTVNMFLGPICDYAVAPIARQIRYWQLPLVTPGAMAGDFGFRKKSMFPLLSRVGSNFNSLLELLVMFLKQFSWHKMKLIYMPDGFENIMDRYCHIAADAIVLGTRMGGINITVDHKSFHELRQLLYHMSDEIGTNWGDHLHCTRNNTTSAPVSSYRSHKENLSTMHELRSTGEDPIVRFPKLHTQ